MQNKNNFNVNYTLSNEICSGCGICEVTCYSEAITIVVEKGNFRPRVDADKCINCGLCVKVCPGIGADLIGMAKTIHIDKNIHEDKYIGRFLNCFTGFSNDHNLRYHSASGGSLTQFLIWLLEKKKIDGAIVTKFDKNSPLKVNSFIATSKEEIISAKSSKYSPVSLHNAIKELRNAPDGRYIVVGLPCHMAGIRKLMAIDKRIREKIAGLFGIYCSGSRTFYMTEYLMHYHNIELDKLDYLAYRDNGCLGGMVAKGDGIDFYEDYQRYCHPLRTMFHPRRCLLCADHFAELADISFGDIHIEPYKKDKIGINSIIARNQIWQNILYEARQDGCLSIEPLDYNLLLKSQNMAKVKKSRYVGYGLLLKKLGKVVPDYGTTYGETIKIKYFIGYIRNTIDRFIGSHKILWSLISIINSKVNIH